MTLLDRGSLFVHLDPRRAHVVVPNQFRSQPELVLQFGYNLRVPIPDLEIDDEGIFGTLSFARRPFWCRIPWEAVFAIVGEDRRGAIWPEDAPPESKIAPADAAPPAPKRSHLRAVGPNDPPPDGSAGSSDDGPLEGEGRCRLCSTRWVEDAASCAVCGATRAEAFVPEAGASAPEPAEPSPISEPEPPPDEPPPEAPPPKRPHLRLVK